MRILFNRPVSEIFQITSRFITKTIALFMAIACTNFTLLYFLLLWKPAKLFGDIEFRVYLIVMAVVSVIVIVALWTRGDYASVEECKAAIDRYFAERNQYFLENPKRAGNKIWGKEITKVEFNESNNSKDPRYG
jgi:hypothetical protein